MFTSEVSNRKLRQRRVLLVDRSSDNKAFRSILLRIQGHDTVITGDGQDAFDAVSQFEPDVILMDLGVSRMKGDTFCHTIRQMPLTSQPIIVAVIGGRSKGDIEWCSEVGYDAHLLKPVEMKKMAATIDRLIVMKSVEN